MSNQPPPPSSIPTIVPDEPVIKTLATWCLPDTDRYRVDSIVGHNVIDVWCYHALGDTPVGWFLVNLAHVSPVIEGQVPPESLVASVPVGLDDAVNGLALMAGAKSLIGGPEIDNKVVYLTAVRPVVGTTKEALDNWIEGFLSVAVNYLAMCAEDVGFWPHAEFLRPTEGGVFGHRNLPPPPIRE